MSSSAEIGTFDYVVVGGGTAGAIVAARLSEDADTRVCLIEAGPSDVGMDDVLLLRRWLSLLEGPIDLAYTTTLQPRGQRPHRALARRRARRLLVAQHADLLQAAPRRLAGLGRPRGRRMGAGGHGAVLRPASRRCIRSSPRRTATRCCWTGSRPRRRPPASRRTPTGTPAPFHDGVGFLDVGYDPETGIRSSSSVAYLHPIMGRRPNLTILTDTWVRRVNLENGRAVSVTTDNGDGACRTRDRRLRRLDRHAAAAAAVRHRPGGRPAASWASRCSTSCPASART